MKVIGGLRRKVEDIDPTIRHAVLSPRVAQAGLSVIETFMTPYAHNAISRESRANTFKGTAKSMGMDASAES